MRFIALIFRYSTFLAAFAGFVMIAVVMNKVHSKDSASIPPPPVSPPQKPYEKTVAATGILEALSENVSIGVPMPGLVTEMLVQVNDSVKAGQALFKLDDRELQAQLISQRASVEVSRANADVQRATLNKTQDMLNRLQGVKDERAISQDDLRNRTNDVAVSKAELAASEAQLKAAEALVKQSEILLERLTVKAPRDSVILQVSLRAGEYASTQPKAPAMVLGDLDKLQVRADVDEQNATRVRVGQPAKGYIKGDTRNPIPLTFVRIEPFVIPKVSLTGASTERVDTRVLQVIYSLQRPKDTPIYVGQQVDVYIDAEVSTTPKS
jgi:HlyD family secretion protein